MEKRYVCFVCHSYHPEMRGVSEEEFNAGRKVCQEEKCVRKGEPLEPALYCEDCGTLQHYDLMRDHVCANKFE